MHHEPQQIEVLFGPDGVQQLGGRGFPRVALVDPDIPARVNELAKYMNTGQTMMRVTVGNMWAIYRLKGVTLAGDQMWTLQATRCTQSKSVHFVDRWGVDSEERKQIARWLLEI